MYKNIFFIGLILLCSCKESPLVPPPKDNIQILQRKYDTNSPYTQNPIFGNPIDKYLNSQNEIIKGEKRKKISGDQINLSKSKRTISFKLDSPKRIDTKGIIRMSKNDRIEKKIALDSAGFSKTPFNLDALIQNTSDGIQLKKVKTKIPELIDAKTPIYKGKAIKNIKYLDVKQGTSSSYIWDVYHDTKNQIWMGTNGGGVSVYTGDKFRHFNEDCGLSNNFVWCIEEDQHGNMWFGTLGQGVCMFDGNNFYQLSLKEGFKVTDINFIYEDNDGLIWIGSRGEGLFIYDGQTAHKIISNQFGKDLKSIFEDDRNRKWIATENGIHIIDEDSITQITKENGLQSHNINKILEDKDGNMWFAYDNHGIDVYDGVYVYNYNEKNYLKANNIYDLVIDSFDNIWIASYSGGLCQFNGSEFIWLDETNGLSGEHVISVTTDDSGNIWAGTDGDGLDIINLNSFQNLNKGNGLLNDYIYAMCEDQNQQIWFGGEEGELMLYKNNEYFTFSQFDDIIEKQINKIYEDSKGRIWVATEGQGVIKITDNRVEIFSKENGLISNQIYEIIEDRNGLLWFGSTKNGLCSFDGETFTHYNEANGLYHNHIRTSSIDLNGNLYFGTWGGGVIKYDGTYFHHITENEGLHSSIIISSYNDSQGNIWLGSLANGACMYNGSDFHYFTKKTGLSDNKIWSIIEDTTTKSIWIGTENGLNQMQNFNYKSKDLNCMTYNWNDGIRCVDFLKSSAIIDQSGILWWGTGKGLTKLIRQDLPSNNSQPRLRLRNISINNKYIDYLNPPDSLMSKISFTSVHKFENVPNDLILSHNNNHLTFDYSGINWSKPQGISYSYMLDGLDPTWSPPTYETHADFTNIPHGSYTFKVKSRISGGKWSEALEYDFIINPPWWATWWARSAYVILTVIFIWLFILQRTRRLKLRQLKLVKEIKKATKEIRERKDEVERQKNSNLEMSKRILEQDKQLILNATANTVAHTLNSPLGAIKAGAESISHIYDDLFSNIIQKCSVEQIAYGYEYAKKFNGKQLESGKGLRLRIKKVIEFLSNKYSITGNEAHDISMRISKIYLETELKSLIDFVLLQKNRIEVLDMIVSLVTFEKITSNTLNATAQSSKVVESLKKALKQGMVENKGVVNINRSVSAVFEVIKDETHKSASIKNKLTDDLIVNNVNEYKLFQLWSNVFNLLLNISKGKLNIEISANKNSQGIHIVFLVDTKIKKGLFKESVYEMIMNQKENSIDLSRAVIKDIIEKYKGEIKIKNEENSSVLTFVLPLNQV